LKQKNQKKILFDFFGVKKNQKTKHASRSGERESDISSKKSKDRTSEEKKRKKSSGAYAEFYLPKLC